MRSSKLVLFAAALAVGFGGPLLAGALKPSKAPAVGIAAEEVGDSVRVVATWSPRNDGKGPADYFLTFWRSTNRSGKDGRTTVPSDTFMVPRPAPADSAIVTVGVASVRRGKVSTDTLRSRLVIHNVDTPPLAPDSIRVDTTLVDSARVIALSVDGRRVLTPEPSGLVIQEGDSVVLTLRRWIKTGMARPTTDTTRWGFRSASGSVLAIRPFGFLNDSAVVVALSCNCKESGDPLNPPSLNLSSGYAGYVVRASVGGWKPVTPLSADPFRSQ